MDAKLNSVGAVVVTYNRRSLLEKALDHLLAQTRPVDHIYIVDNASTDGTEEYLLTLNDAKISYRRLSMNTGGAGGFSYGMKWAFDEGHEWIWLMDDDVAQMPQCLEGLLKRSTESKILLPLAASDDGGHLAWLAMRLNLTSPLTMGFRLLSARHLYPTIESLPEVLRLEDLSFEGPLIHRSVPERVGFPRSDFFIGFDDTEYGIRALHSKLGPILLVRDAVMKRLKSQSPTYPLWREYYHWRNELIVRSADWAHPLMRIRVRLMFLIRTCVGCLLRRESLTKTRARIHAFIDSLPGRPLSNRYMPG
jgi:rhamnopyranosyl-N-acetylglucosaminyl-diphospho-decaprenol beta-1,3/1,4-galactofuranosyltransferase